MITQRTQWLSVVECKEVAKQYALPVIESLDLLFSNFEIFESINLFLPR